MKSGFYSTDSDLDLIILFYSENIETPKGGKNYIPVSEKVY